MIKLSTLDNILKKSTRQGLIKVADYQFKTAYNTPGEAFVGDLGYKNYTQLPTDDLNFYMQEGYNNLSAVSMSLPKKKQFDPMTLPQAFVLYTGFLGKEAAIGVDTVKGRSSAIYTRNESILRELFKEGAFEDTYTIDDLEKDIGKMNKKVATGLDKGSLAYARLDLINAMKNTAVFKITLPNFRTDFGEALKFYPYGVFPYLATLMKETVKDNAITVFQSEDDGSTKVRSVSFTDKAVKVLYRGFEPVLVENKLRKVTPGWDVLSLDIKAYNLEASLYSQGYTGIHLEDTLQITSCKLSDIDKTQYMVNYDELKKHFIASVNKWNLPHYDEFKGMDLSGYATKEDKRNALSPWLKEIDGEVLYNIMKAQEHLFGGDLVERLDKVSNNSPKEFKKLEYIELPEDKDEKTALVKDMLKKGIVKLSRTSKKSNKVTEVVCTNNGVLLSRILGKNYIENYESPGIKIRYLVRMLTLTNLIDNVKQLEDKLYSMDLNNYMNVGDIDSAAFEATAVQNKAIEDKRTAELLAIEIQSIKEKMQKKGASDAEIQKEITAPKVEKRCRDKAKGENIYTPYAQAVNVIKGGEDNVRDTTSQDSPYLIRYRKVYAENAKDFHRSIDIDNVVAVEYAELGK